MAQIYVIFNKLTKLPIFLTEDKMVVQLMEAANNPIRIVETDTLGLKDDVFNVSRWKWEGDYDTGKMIDAFRKNEFHVTEEEVDGKYRELLLRKYSIDKMLEMIIMEMPKTQVWNHEKEQYEYNQEFAKLYDFVWGLSIKKDKEIEFFKNSPVHKFETWEDIKNREEAVYKV